MSDPATSDSDLRWKRRYERERNARREAERLLEDKSRELYASNRALTQKAEELASTVDELRRAQSDLIESESMAALGGLVAGVAHEVSTPLSVAYTAATLAQDSVDELAPAVSGADAEDAHEEVRDAFAMIVSNLERAVELIQDFRQVAVDRTSGRIRILDATDLARRTVASLLPMLRRAGVSVDVRGPDDLCVRLPAGEFAQIVTNLVQNASVHAFPPDATSRTVEVELRDEGEQILLVCRDDGKGMTPEIAGRVFEPFFTTREGRGGSGLGLHLVQTIVRDRFGGEITMETAPGQGTSWYVELPFEGGSLERSDGCDSL